MLALARRLGVRGRNKSTATQPGAAPDRPQCCRFSGFSARLIFGRSWRAAGELSVVSLRLHRCVKQGVLWPLEVGRFGRGLAASALSVGAACSLWRGVWVRVVETNQQQHNKSSQPTAYGLRSFLASVSALPAAGKLNRCVAAPAVMRETGSTLAAGSRSLRARLGGVGCVGGRGLVALARRLGCGG